MKISRPLAIAYALGLYIGVVILIFIFTAAFAESIHSKNSPSCASNGTTVTCTGEIAGVGNGAVTVVLELPSATATTTCTNAGGNKAPGQNPALPVPVSGSTVLPPADKNGNQSYSVTTNPSPAPTWAQAGCANSNWVAALDKITYGVGSLTFYQNGALAFGPVFVPVR